MCHQIRIGFGFTCDWMKKWREFFLSRLCSVIMQNQLVFDTQVKTVLKSFLNKKSRVSFPDVLSVIAQVPAPGTGPSGEKLDFDDDTLKGEGK